MPENRARLGRNVTAIAIVAFALSGCSISVAGQPAPAGVAAAAPAGTASPRSTRSSAPPEAATTAAVPGRSRFDDAAGRFGLVPPTGWTVDTSGAQSTAVVFFDPEPTSSAAGTFSANINVLVAPAGDADLPATIAGARRELQGLTAYAATFDQSLVLGDGTPAHLLGGTFSDGASGFDLRNLQLFTVHNGSTIVVTGTALVESWDRYATTFDTSLRTLSVGT